MHQLILEITESMHALLQQHQAKLELDLQAHYALIKGDRLHLTNLLFNLMDNACKYSGPSPAIRIATENRKGQLCLLVSDKGKGIAREQQKKVFERFYRVADTATDPGIKGFGLGLYYVKNVVKAHRGRIRLESLPGQGSTFQLHFPQPSHTL